MLTTELQKAQHALKQLLDLRQIRRVVCVDDEYMTSASSDEIIALCTNLGTDVCSTVLELPPSFFEGGPDVWEPNLSTYWDKLDQQVQQRVYRNLQFRANAPVSVDDVIAMCEKVGTDICETLPELQDIPFREEGWRSLLRDKWGTADIEERSKLYRELQFRDRDDERIDAVAAGTLAGLLEGYELLELTPADWDTNRDGLLQDAKTTNTLFLFDQDLHKAGKRSDEGIWLIKDVLETTDHTLMCGLLSHTFSQAESYELWYQFADAIGVSRHRFIPLSKRLLHGDFVIFARMVKLTILTSSSALLKQQVNQKILEAQAEAHAKVEELDIYDFEHIVFQSSRREGVWEPDTLFRIFALFHRSITLRLAREDAELHGLATHIRRISQVDTHSSEAPKHGSWKIQRLELYDSADYINSLYMPIELGDVFLKEGGTSSYILLAQPCDLMVRSTGKRKSTMIEALLARVSMKAPADKRGVPTTPENYYELPYFNEIDGSNSYVLFRETQAVRLEVLDMCAYNPDGIARIKVDAVCPDNVIPAWEKHHAELCRHWARILTKYRTLSGQRLPSDTRSAILKSVIPQSSNGKLFVGEVHLTENIIQYTCKRTHRLRQPHATAMLSKFAVYLARAALEMDFGREWDEEEDSADVPS